MSDSTYSSVIQPPSATKSKTPDRPAEPSKGVSTPTSDPNAPKSRIRDVWKVNFEEERVQLMKLLEKYTTVAVDIEYPGVVFQKGEIQDYSTIKKNVDALKMIQVGFSVSDDNGNLPEGVNTWQFNLHFDLTKDPHSQDSIQLLRTAGLNFDNHAAHGIDQLDFAEWFTVSNLPFNDDIKWICFSGCYDFPYLLKSLMNKLLPPNESEFYNELKMYFPTFYDLKFITKDFPNLKYYSLQKLATELGRPRTGKNHQAGSDALLTLETFFKVKEVYTRNFIDNYKYGNILAGMNGERGDDHSNQVDSYSPFASPALFPDYTAQFMANPLFAAFPQLNMPQQAMGANLAMYHYYPEFAMGKQVPGNMGILYQGYTMDGF